MLQGVLLHPLNVRASGEQAGSWCRARRAVTPGGEERAMSPVATARREWDEHSVATHCLVARLLGPDPVDVSWCEAVSPHST